VTVTEQGASLIDPQQRVEAPPPRRVPRWVLAVGSFAALLLLLSAARIATGQHEITSSGTISAALLLIVPIGLAGLGGLFSERAGVVNIGLEGMMILGTWGAGWFGYQWGPWAAIVGGLLFGALGGALHALATVGFGVDHIVSGVAINLIAAGVARFLSEVSYGGVAGGGATQSPGIKGDAPQVSLPVLTTGPDLLGRVERTHLFLVSDLAGILRGITHDVSVVLILAVLLVPASWYLLWRTAFGLRLRSCGENPVAAESLGVNVYRYKTIAVVLSGALAGLGGVFLVFVADIYKEGQTAGRGFIGLAAMIFGNWRPGGLALGSVLFGFADALQLRSAGAVLAVMLAVGVLLVGYGVWLVARGRGRIGSLIGGVVAIAAGVGLSYGAFVVEQIPNQFVQATPYLITLLVLGLASQRLRMPAADGLRYRKGMDK